MAETKVLSPSEVAEEHQQEAHAPYLLVWFWLAILTGVEYFYAAWLKDFFIDPARSACWSWAGIKAGLVGWYFMHLKFEGKWVYLLIVPAIILATILVLALVPDQVFKYADRGRRQLRVVDPRGGPEVGVAHVADPRRLDLQCQRA